MNRLYLELAAAVILLGAFGLYTYHERQVGAQQCKYDVEQAVTKARKESDDRYAAQQKVSTSIGDQFDVKTAAPPATPAPVVIVKRVHDYTVCPDSLPTAGAPTRSDHGETDIRKADTGDPGIDIGAPLIAIGKAADALAEAHDRYINEVCLKP